MARLARFSPLQAWVVGGWLLVLVSWTACAEEPAAPAPHAEAATPAAAPDAPLLTLETTDEAARVTYRPTGRTFTLFEHDRVEDSEEGTTHHLLSSFGPYVSYRTEWYYEGGAHPSYGQAYHAVVVGDTLEEADLRQLFSEEALYTALRATPLAQDAAPETATLGALLDALAQRYDCEMNFGGFFSSFFVREVSADTATVVVGLTHGCEVERGNFTTIPLQLPIASDQRKRFGDLRLFSDQVDE